MNDVVTVFAAEFLRRVRSRPFLIGLGIGVLVLLLMTKLPALFERLTPASANRVVIVADAKLEPRVDALLRHDFIIAANLITGAPDAAMLKAHDADTALVVEEHTKSLAVVVYSRTPSNISRTEIRRDLLPLELQRATNLSAASIENAVRMPVDVRAIASKFGSSQEEEAAHGVVFTMLFFLYITILLNSQLIMSSVAEEKTSRIAELLIAAIDPSVLLIGKIAAGTALAMLQLLLWMLFGLFFGGAGGGGSSAAAGPSMGLAALLTGNLLSPGTILAFFAFFLLGLLQLSTLFAGIASMINRTEDIGSIAGPLVIPVVFALVLAVAAIDAPDASWAIAMSFVPIFSPFVMFARIAVGLVPAWEILLSIGVNVLALALIAWGAGRIYRVGMLFYGRAPSLSQIWKALRTA